MSRHKAGRYMDRCGESDLRGPSGPNAQIDRVDDCFLIACQLVSASLLDS